ncbi:MAG: sigma-70 family RNA polymerase sigma factor [Oscillospiraceae bacterium]
MDGEGKINIDELWHQYAAGKDPEIKNQILYYYIPLVKSTVRRLMPKYKGYNESDDLLNCGVIGLIDAVDKYDINYGVKFETYASMRIRGEILDYMREQDWAPSSLRKKINGINQAVETLECELGHCPTDREIAGFMKIPVTEVRKVLERAQMFNLMYFEDMVTDTYFVERASASEDNNPAEILQNEEMRRILAEIIESLPDKERLVITLYYYEEMTLKEIAVILKVTESRVSQIHSKVLTVIGDKLKKAIY